MTGSLDSSGGDLERDILRLMLGTNAALLVDRLGQGPPGDQGSVIAALTAATSLGSVLDDVVVSLVRQAPLEGRSWAAIGYALQVSRQAAFQRFASRTGEAAEGREGPPDASRLALRSLRQFLDGEFDALRADFNERMTEACPVSLLVRCVRAWRGKWTSPGTWQSPCHARARLHRRRHPHHVQEGSAKRLCSVQPGRPYRRLIRARGRCSVSTKQTVHDPIYQTDNDYEEMT